MGKQHLDLFPAATSGLVFRCRSESPGNVAGVFVQSTRNLAGDRMRAATWLEFTNVTILLAGAIEACAFGGDAGPWGSVGPPELDQLFARRARISVPFGIESKVGARIFPSVRMDLSKTGMCGVIFFWLTSQARFSAEP
jgi:hypothetical protein